MTVETCKVCGDDDIWDHEMCLDCYNNFYDVEDDDEEY